MLTHSLKGSTRKPYRGARPTQKADPNERIVVSVLVRRKAAEELTQAANHAGRTRGGHIDEATFEQKYGAMPSAVAAVKTFAAAHGLTIVKEHLSSRTIKLSGTVAQFNVAFGVDLQRFEYDGGSYRGRTGDIKLPDELVDAVDAILGLDNRPQAQPCIRQRAARPEADGGPPNIPTSFTAAQIASLYNFPAGTGNGQCVALIELGGGYAPGDLATYFNNLGIATPNVFAVSVDNGTNQPTGDMNGDDGEVLLDIEVVGAVAPQASIVVYFAPNNDASFLDAVTTAIHDTTYKPSVISISWASPESDWSEQLMTGFDQAFQAAAALGITVCVASGDSGSSGGVGDGADHVNFPASSPYALACGGTTIALNDGGAIASETVWNDGGGATGGGVSTFFSAPQWQEGQKATLTSGGVVPLTMRGVPDVAGNADPNSGYAIHVDGQDTVVGGTSAVAPLWAGLIARINAQALNNGQNGSPVGYLNPRIYPAPAGLTDIIEGNNGSYAAAPGWDACTGLGRPGANITL